MRHPEAKNDIGWVPVAFPSHGSSYSAAFPWWKVALVCFGASCLTFAAGYFLASSSASREVEQAQDKASEALAEAEQIKASATGDLQAAQLKVKEQQQRLRLVNDCVYSALNEPLPTPVPNP